MLPNQFIGAEMGMANRLRYSQIEMELTMTDPAFGEAANRDVVVLAARIRELRTAAPPSR